jgi:hypothetical protein
MPQYAGRVGDLRAHQVLLPHSLPGSSWARSRTGWQRRPVLSGTDVSRFRSRLKSQLPSP